MKALVGDKMSPNMKPGDLSVAWCCWWCVILMVVVVFHLLLTICSSGRNRQRAIRRILADANTRDVGVDSLAAERRNYSSEPAKARTDAS